MSGKLRLGIAGLGTVGVGVIKIIRREAALLRARTGTEITILANYSDQESDTAHQFLPVTGTLLPAPGGQEIDPYVYHGAPGFNAYDTQSFALSLIVEQELSQAFSLHLVDNSASSLGLEPMR